MILPVSKATIVEIARMTQILAKNRLLGSVFVHIVIRFSLDTLRVRDIIFRR